MRSELTPSGLFIWIINELILYDPSKIQIIAFQQYLYSYIIVIDSLEWYLIGIIASSAP
jgi:hypothetical protein